MDYNINLPRPVTLKVSMRPHDGNDDHSLFTNRRLMLVNWATRPARKNQVLHFAKFFRREFRYDFVQFGSAASESEDNFEAWLFFSDRILWPWGEERPIGAACFRKRSYSDLPQYKWALQWIWIHPYERAQGLWKTHFEFFKQRYGGFIPEPPLSKSMESFVRKYYPEVMKDLGLEVIEKQSEVAGQVIEAINP